jgi:hypothetical protein
MMREEEKKEGGGGGRRERREKEIMRSEEGTFHPAGGLIPPGAFVGRCGRWCRVCTMEDGGPTASFEFFHSKPSTSVHLIGQKNN